MINRVIWKVLLMGGGLVGGIYSFPKFVEAYSDWQDCINDSYSMYLGPWIEEYQSDAVKFGILSIVSIFAFIIGCCISANMNQNDNQQAESNSNEESN